MTEMNETHPPHGLVPRREGDNFYYWRSDDPDAERGGLVIFPCSQDGSVVLDGTFTPGQLRAVADWVEGVPHQDSTADLGDIANG